MSNHLPAQVLAHTVPSRGLLLQPPSWQPVAPRPPPPHSGSADGFHPPQNLPITTAASVRWCGPLSLVRVSLSTPTEMWAPRRSVVFAGSIIMCWRSEPHRRGPWHAMTISESSARLSSWHSDWLLSLGDAYCIDINADEIQILKISKSTFQRSTKIPLAKTILKS